MSARAVVIGGGIEGVQAALDIANSGIEVVLVEQSPSLTEFGRDVLLQRPRFLEAANHPHIQILTDAEVTRVEGAKGSFRLKVLQHPRYVDREVCVSCGRCEHACTVNIVSHAGGKAHKAHKAIHLPDFGLKSVPSACVIDKTGLAPCTAACPAGINVQGYVALISRGKLREALAMVREAVPFPHILGRVCTHPCEDVCTRGRVDQPIAIASLKRYLADMEPSQYTLMPTEVVAPDSPRRVAIIGSGPAGLTCARDLVRMGHNSTLFEALPVPGGMVAVGMPRFRLPHEVREAEINAITNLGVEIKTNTPIGEGLTLDDLKSQGYEAIFIASGAHKNQTLNIPGEDLEGVIDSIALLRSVNLKKPIRIGRNVVVVGGGYTAIDSARTAIRLNRARSRILYRRMAVEMAATEAEILETIEEGVDMTFLAAPVSIIGERGKVVGIECQEMELGGLDETGRRRPVPVEGATFTLKCDTVIPAIGQLSDLTIFEHGDIRLDNNGRTLIVDPLTLGTNVPGIFAGGDVVSGPRSMVEAVGDGRRAAVSIDRLLRGEDLSFGRTLEKLIPIEVDLSEVRVPPGGRRRIPVLPVKERRGNFEEVERGYTTFMALRESKRCLGCGGCSECMECVNACELQAINHEMQPVETELEAGAVVFAATPPAQLSLQGAYVIGQGDGPIQAAAIAGKVIIDLAESRLGAEVRLPGPALQESLPVDISEPKIGIFICRCGGNISDVIDVDKLARQFFRQSSITYVHQIGYACSDEGASEIREVAREHGITHVVLAACACCGLDQICFSCSDRRIACKEKLLGHAQDDGLYYEFVNIREHCVWVHARQPERALVKAKALIRGGIARVMESRPDEVKSLSIREGVAVIGGGVSGLQAAADLAAMGIQTTLIADGKLLSDENLLAVRILDDARLKEVEGTIGDYTITVKHRGESLKLAVGAIVIDLSAIGKKRLPSILQAAVTDGEGRYDQSDSRVPGIFLCGPVSARKDSAIALMQGSAVASKVSALLSKGAFQPVQTIAVVDPEVCRGCGTCVTICEFGAASLVEQSPGIFISTIDEAICRGCGTCVAHCPSNAINQNGLTDCQITASLEAMLVG